MPYQMWINGEYTTGSSGKVIEVRNPATEEFIDTAPAANAADVERVVSAGHAAFDEAIALANDSNMASARTSTPMTRTKPNASSRKSKLAPCGSTIP